jgi:hypothetical protein
VPGEASVDRQLKCRWPKARLVNEEEGVKPARGARLVRARLVKARTREWAAPGLIGAASTRTASRRAARRKGPRTASSTPPSKRARGTQRIVHLATQTPRTITNTATAATKKAAATAAAETIVSRDSKLIGATRSRHPWRCVAIANHRRPQASFAVPDVHLERVRGWAEVVAPNAIEDRRTGQHLLGIEHEELEQSELRARQFDGHLATPDEALTAVEFDVGIDRHTPVPPAASATSSRRTEALSGSRRRALRSSPPR